MIKKTENIFLCVDCSIDTGLHGWGDKNYYMVTDDIWKKYGVGEQMLCIDCLEKRMGRKLTKDDFTLCQLNTQHNPYTKSILGVA